MFSKTGALAMICIFLIQTPPSSQSRILMIPINMNSHIIYFARLGQGLSQNGHYVEMLVPSNAKVSDELTNGSFVVTKYPVESNISMFNTEEVSEKFVGYAANKSKFIEIFKFLSWFLTNFMAGTDKDCRALMHNKLLIRELIDERKFEFAVLDVMSTDCYIFLPKIMNIKYSLLSIPFLAWYFGIPRLPSFVPNSRSKCDDHMSFSERFKTFMLDLFGLSMPLFAGRPDFSKEFFPEGTHHKNENFLDIIQNASLWLFLEDITLGYPRPNMPHTISVGDIVAGQVGSPITSELNQFIGSSDAVLISFGSYIDYLNEETEKKFCSSFKLLKNVRFIFKSKNKTVCGYELKNLLILQWVPQNDLLADARLKLFVTHGGFNSMMESIYHAKPVLVFPLGIDQISSAAYAAKHNYGLEMDFVNWSVEEFVHNVIHIIEDKTFKESINKASNILKDKTDSAAGRVSHAINHVLKFGDEHLKSASRDLYWFQFIMFDIFLVLTILFLFTASIIFFIFFKLYKKIKSTLMRLLKYKHE